MDDIRMELTQELSRESKVVRGESEEEVTFQ